MRRGVGMAQVRAAKGKTRGWDGLNDLDSAYRRAESLLLFSVCVCVCLRRTLTGAFLQSCSELATGGEAEA